MNPENLTFKELVHYGLETGNPWVVCLAAKCVGFADMLPEKYVENVEWFMEENNERIHGLEWEVEDRDETIDRLTDELEKSKKDASAVRYQLTTDYQVQRIKTLEAEVYDIYARNQELKHVNEKVQRENYELQEEIKLVREQMDMWTVLCKPSKYFA